MGEPYVLVARFYVESDALPDTLRKEFELGLENGGPLMEAAYRFPGGEVLGANVQLARTPTPEERANYFPDLA